MARGDHIKVRRLGGLYHHHGIDMGDGTVIHLCGEPLRTQGARVCRVAMEEFLQGGQLEFVPGPEKVLESDEIVAAAESLVGVEGYDILLNNCEHFVYFCRTGWRRSVQVEHAVRGATLVASGVVVLSATVLGALLRHRLGRA